MLTGILRFRKVEDVTSPKDEPAPVYLLDELVKATQTSPEDAQHIVESLVKKLDSKSPVVKAKSLRACKYLVQKGARDAHRILQRNAAPIRQLQNYKGVTDPLKGDALNERVRTSAKEAVAAIFSSDTPAVQLPTASQSRIQGFGSQSVMPPPSGGLMAIGSRMVGFGSERFNASTDTIGSSAVPSYDPQPTYNTNRQTASFLSSNQNLDVENGQRQTQSSFKYGSVLGDEAQLVDSICQPGGVRSAPAKEDIRRFIDTAGSLNGPKIALLLQEKVEGNNWQECYRALCAIEAVILEGSSLSCGEIGVHFHSDLDIIRRCANSMQKSVRDRAQRILDIFVEVDDVDSHDPRPTEDAPPLIDGVIEDTPSNAASTLDLLDDSSSGLKEPVQSNVFNGLDAIADPVETPATKDGNPPSDMFSGLALTDPSTPAKGSNEHLAALLAPSPASDPFPEAKTPLKAESSVQPQLQPPIGNQSSYPPPMPGAPMPGMMPPYGAPQPVMMGAPFAGQVPMMPPQQGGMPYMVSHPMQPNMAPAGYPPMMMNPYGSYVQTSQPPTQPQGQIGVNRGEVPLAAFMGPAHIERRNSSGKNQSHFSFIGDHMSELREKK